MHLLYDPDSMRTGTEDLFPLVTGILSGEDLSGLVLVLAVIPISTASESMWLKLDLYKYKITNK